MTVLFCIFGESILFVQQIYIASDAEQNIFSLATPYIIWNLKRKADTKLNLGFNQLLKDGSIEGRVRDREGVLRNHKKYIAKVLS